MQTHLVKQILLFISFWSGLFSNIQAEPSTKTRSMEQLLWAVEQLNLIIRKMPAENRELREQAIQRRDEILKELYKQETRSLASFQA